MKILYLTPFDPTVKEGGGFLRSTLMWNALQSIGEVDTVVVKYDGIPYVNEVKRIRGVQLVSVFRSGWRFSVYKFLSLFLRHMDWAFLDRASILKLLGCRNDDYDCVVVRYGYLAWRTAAWKIAPVYVDFDDLPSEVYRTIHMPKQLKIKGYILLCLERWWERFVALQCAGVWLSNPEQLNALPSSVCRKALCNIGNVPSAEYRIGMCPKNIIVTLGTYGHEPNRTGIAWFLQEMWPRISLKYPKLELHIVGRVPEDYKSLAAHWASIPGVRVLGFVEDIEEIYESALCSLAAVTSGSGTCVKVIESAMFGRIVLATPFAARGLSDADRHGLGVSLFENPDEFIKCIACLLSESETEREKRRRDVQAYANNAYSFARFRGCVVDMFNGSCGESGAILSQVCVRG